MIKLLLVFTFCTLMNTAMMAQQIQLVKDINTKPSSNSVSLNDHVVVNGKIFYLTYSPFGRQLFVTDGTESGTLRLTDNDEGEDEPYNLTTGNGYVFYKSWQYDNYYLFRSDGTKEGTFPLRKLSTSFYDRSAMLEIDGTIYFSGHDGRDRIQLWKTDGTTAGTMLVKDLGVRGSNRIQDFYNFNGKLYFIIRSNNNPGSVSTIWSSDGTEAGTKAGANYVASANSYGFFNPATAGNYMYFSDSDVLYKTDGASITPVTSGLTDINNPITIGTKVYFTTGEEEEEHDLYSMNPDGTGITALISGMARISRPIAIGKKIFFTANDRIHGRELWKTDGTVAGTVLIKDIYPGNNSSDPEQFTNLNGTLYFSARSTVRTEIWKSDGTAAGTVQVTNLNADNFVFFISNLEAAGNNLVFTDEYQGGRLWKTDGTAAGTVLLTNFTAFTPVLLGNNVVFYANPSSGGGLFRTNLTTGSTGRITRIVNENSYPENLINADGTLYFSTDFSSDSLDGLWKSDGTTAGTMLVEHTSYRPFQLAAANGKVYYTIGTSLFRLDETMEDAVPVPIKTGVKSFTIIGNTVYFMIQTSGRQELWKSEGTSATTSFIRAFATSDDLPFVPIAFKGQLYFAIYQNGYKIWKSNGTGSGTQLAPEFASSGSLITSSEGTTFSVIGDNLYGFFDSGTGTKLIKSNGTLAGTTTAASLPFSPASLFGAGGLVYMTSATLADEKKLLWRTDGTVNGTFQLTSLDVKLNYNTELGRPADPFRLQTDVNGKLFFMNTNTALGDQLWVSDGTVAGTRRITQAKQSRIPFFTRHTESLGGLLYFDYYEPATGGEIWQSDGTPEGTHVLEDFTPNGNTGIRDMKRLNNILMMSAFTESTGYELYKFEPAIAAPSLRINSGGAAFTASGSRAFSADQYFTGTTQVSNAIAGDITATADDQLYKEQRFGSSFSYNVPVTNGTYNVVLHFAEIYWGIPSRSGTTGTARRQFHVNMEGARKLTNYDIFVKAGGAMRAGTETFPVTVTDGILNIDFLKGAADNPIIAAIEVVPTQVTLGPLADAYIRNTPHEATNYGTAGILEVKTGSLPSYQRGTYLKFPLAGVSQVNSAKLRLYGYNAQSNATIGISAFGVSNDDWTETGINWSNAPLSSAPALGSVNVNGTARYYEIDVTAFVKSQLATDKIVSLYITNPANQNVQLSFYSRENEAYPPQLVIESLAPPAARSGSDEDAVVADYKQEVSGIYPNPAGKRFTVHISKAHQGKVDFQLISLSGNTYQISPVQPATPASKVDMDISSMQLPKGIYILKIQSNAFKERVKLLLTE